MFSRPHLPASMLRSMPDALPTRRLPPRPTRGLPRAMSGEELRVGYCASLSEDGCEARITRSAATHVDQVAMKSVGRFVVSELVPDGSRGAPRNCAKRGVIRRGFPWVRDAEHFCNQSNKSTPPLKPRLDQRRDWFASPYPKRGA